MFNIDDDFDVTQIKLRKALLGIREKKQKIQAVVAHRNSLGEDTKELIPHITKRLTKMRRNASRNLDVPQVSLNKSKHTLDKSRLEEIKDLDSSEEWEGSTDSNSSLIEKLLKRQHPIFKKALSPVCKREHLLQSPTSQNRFTTNNNHVRIISYLMKTRNQNGVQNPGTFSKATNQAKSHRQLFISSPKRNSGESPKSFPKLEEVYLKAKKNLNFHSINDFPISKIENELKNPPLTVRSPRRRNLHQNSNLSPQRCENRVLATALSPRSNKPAFVKNYHRRAVSPI